MEIPKDTRRALAHFSLISLVLLVIMFLAFLVLMPGCATLSKFLQLEADPFLIKLVFLEETISVNIPGHWPKDILEFPESEAPFFYPIWIKVYTDPETDMTYHFAIHTLEKKIYLLLEYKTYPDPDDRVFYIFIDGLPIKVGLNKVRKLWDRIKSGSHESSKVRAKMILTEGI